MEATRKTKGLIRVLRDDGSLHIAGYFLAWSFVPYIFPSAFVDFFKPYALLVADIIPNITVYANNSPNPDLILCFSATQWLLCPLYIIFLLNKTWHEKKGEFGFFRRLYFTIIIFALLYASIALPKQISLSSISKVGLFLRSLHDYLWPNFLFLSFMPAFASLCILGLIVLFTGSRPFSELFGGK